MFNTESKCKWHVDYTCSVCNCAVRVSIGKKYQLKFAQFLLEEESPEIEGIIQILSKHSVFIGEKLGISQDEYNCYLEIKYKGTTYKNNLIVTKFEDNVLIACKIVEIIVCKNSSVYILTNQLEILSYEPHFLYYKTNTECLPAFSNLRHITEFDGQPICITKMSNGTNFIRLKHFF